MYYVDAPTVTVEFWTGTASAEVYFFTGLFTLTTYALAGWAREQVCTYMCPWPRFQSAMLDWESRNEPAGHQRLALVQELLVVRRREIIPRLANAAFGEAQAADNGLLTASWRLGDDTRLRLRANLSISKITGNPRKTCIPIWGGEPGDVMMPWSVFWRLEPR